MDDHFPERPPRRLLLVLYAMLLVLYAWPMDFNHGPNVIAHIDQAFAITSTRTLAIDQFMKPQPNTIDWAQAPDGRYFPAKAPGAALFAVPVTWVLYHTERAAGIDPLAQTWLRRNLVIINWIMNAAVSAGAMVLLFLLAVSLDVPPRPAMVGTVAIALGTAYTFTRRLTIPRPAANAVIAAAFLIWRRTPQRWTDAIAGLLVGTAVLFDYPAVFAAVTFGCALLSLGPHRLWPYIAGGLVAVAVLFWYHDAAFGSPFATPYAYQNPLFTAPGGRFLELPNARVLAHVTITPYRGIFVYSPAILLGLFGAFCVGEIAMGAHSICSADAEPWRG